MVNHFRNLNFNMHIFLIRHAMTEQNNKRLIINDHSDFGLSKEGIIQAIKLKNKFNNKKNYIIYTSPLKRCRQTAEIIFAQSINKIRVAPELKELNKGFVELVKKRPNLKSMTVDEWELEYNNSDDPAIKRSYVYPSGESISLISSRVIAFLNRLIRKSTDHDLIIVSHNSPIKAIIVNALGVANAYNSILIEHASYSELIYNDGKFVLSELNAG